MLDVLYLHKAPNQPQHRVRTKASFDFGTIFAKRKISRIEVSSGSYGIAGLTGLEVLGYLRLTYLFLAVYLSIYLPLDRRTHLFIYMSLHPSVHLSVCLSVSIYLSSRANGFLRCIEAGLCSPVRCWHDQTLTPDHN